MKILIVEDDELKRERIKGFLVYSYSPSEIKECASYQSGREAVLSHEFDLVILDMSMPIFDISSVEDGGRPQPYGGKKILQQMKRRSVFIPSIVVTQFEKFGEGKNLKTLPELDKELRAEFSIFYKGSVYYHASQDDWQEKLKTLIKKMATP